MPPPSPLITGPGLGPPPACHTLGWPRPPGRDLLVVTTQQYRRDIHSAIARRPRVARRGEQPVVMRVARRRFVIAQDRKSTRLNSSHSPNSYAVFCFEKKKHITQQHQLL